MKNAVLFAGLILFLALVANVVIGKAYGPQKMDKLDAGLVEKLGRPGDEKIKVMVWVDKEKYGRLEAENLGDVKREFDIIPAVAMDVKKSKIRELASAGFVKKITIDRPVRVFRNNAISVIRADTAMNTFGYNGTGIKIAIIDTGVFNHTEFQTPNRIILQKCFTQNACPPNNAATSDNATDDHGHGTHVAGIAAGEGGSSGRGSVPNATIMAIKVLDSAGDGYDSDIVSGMQFAVDSGANIISMSLGADYNTFTDCYDLAASAAVDNATSRGIVVVVAAGNNGPSSRTMAAPACAKTAITVGNTDKTDKIYSSSSRGPTNDNRTKPDIVATGTSITSTYPSYLGGNYATATGTSMAAPFVAGVAATLMQKYNDSFGYLPKPGLVKAMLLNTANTSNMTLDGYAQRNNHYGSGRVDAYEVLNAMNNATNGSITQGAQKYYSVLVYATSLKATLLWMENSTTRNHLTLIAGNGTHNFTNPSDVNDTVEQLFLSGMNNGTWTIYVNGTSVAGIQEYFLAHSANGTIIPVFSNNITGKNSGVSYAPGENYSFQIKVNGSVYVDQVSAVFFELNETNYTKNSLHHVFNNSDGNFWINITDLSAGIYSYRWLANSTLDAWGTTPSLVFTISKNYSASFINLTLNGTNSDLSLPYDSITNATGWKLFTEGNLTLYRNGSVVGMNGINRPNETLILSGGVYNYTLVFLATQNYSFVNMTRTLTITKRPSAMTLLLNGSGGDFVYNLSTFANFTSTVNISGKNLTLTSNISGWLDQNNTDRINNETLLSRMGIFNITAYFTGDENYSASSQTRFATVVDVTSPLIDTNSSFPSSGVQYLPGRTYVLNVTLQDNSGISVVILQLNATNYTASRFGGNATHGNWSANITDLAANATGYPIIWYINDTSNNWNRTAIWYYSVNKNASAYTTIRTNVTVAEISNPFHVNASSIDANIETRIYVNSTSAIGTLVLASNSNGVNTFPNAAGEAGIFNASANSSSNENYTANATLEYVTYRVVDTTPPTLVVGSVMPHSVSANRNISISAISDDYSANSATVNVFNATNASIARFNLDYIVHHSEYAVNRTTFSRPFNATGLGGNILFVNVSLADVWGNAANYTVGNFSVISAANSTLYSNTSVPVKNNIEINLSSELNVSLNISTITNSGSLDTISIVSYTTNPSDANNDAIAINKFVEIFSGGFLNTSLNWVEMKMFYSASDIFSGYSENNLRIYYNHPNGTWLLFNGTNVGGVNTTEKYVWANSTHFSIYGVFIMPTCSDSIQNQGETGVDCGGPCSACVTITTRQSTDGGGGGSTTATTTTIKITTTTTTTTTTIEMIQPTTTLATTNNNTNATADNNITTNNLVYADRIIQSQILLLVSVTTMVVLIVGTVYKNRKNIERLIKNLRNNLRLD